MVDWLEEVEGKPDSLLTEAAQAKDPVDACFYGSSHLMANIAPRVWGDNGSDEELLLFAAISSYQDTKPSGWTDCATFVEDAFGHLHTIGELEAARQLRQWVDHRSSAEYAQLRREADKRMGRSLDPAHAAAQDRELAQANHRALRAAAVLDPAGNIAPWDRVQ